MHPEQIKIYQSMTPVQKLEVAFRLYETAKTLKATAIKERHRTGAKKR
jgi:hypothetical protein